MPIGTLTLRLTLRTEAAAVRGPADGLASLM
jgi:hypothetical protein